MNFKLFFVIVSPTSRIMASKSRGMGERIEDRLLREGKATEQRRKKKVKEEEMKFNKGNILNISTGIYLGSSYRNSLSKFTTGRDRKHFSTNNKGKPKVYII